MQKHFTLIFTLLLITATTAFAKIWRVNNNTGITANFTTAQAAHDGATAGDTIHLEPSVASYGSLSTSKRLVWLSTGDFLSSYPGLQYSPNIGYISGLNVNGGSENSTFSINFDYGNCNASSVTFFKSRTYSNYLAFNSASACAVIDCFIYGYINLSNSSNNVTISNNIIAYNVNVSSNSSAIIVNNVINTIGSNGGSTLNNAQIQNNIFIAAPAYTFVASNVNNNMANNAMLPAGNGNLNNINMASVFEPIVAPDGYLLKTGSPAIGTGFGGIDMGAFGGSTPYRLALQPAIPAIYQINAPAAPTGATMNVTFSTKSNN